MVDHSVIQVSLLCPNNKPPILSSLLKLPPPPENPSSPTFAPLLGKIDVAMETPLLLLLLHSLTHSHSPLNAHLTNSKRITIG